MHAPSRLLIWALLPSCTLQHVRMLRELIFMHAPLRLLIWALLPSRTLQLVSIVERAFLHACSITSAYLSITSSCTLQHVSMIGITSFMHAPACLNLVAAAASMAITTVTRQPSFTGNYGNKKSRPDHELLSPALYKLVCSFKMWDTCASDHAALSTEFRVNAVGGESANTKHHVCRIGQCVNMLHHVCLFGHYFLHARSSMYNWEYNWEFFLTCLVCRTG
jgi:hypothetical protein